MGSIRVLRFQINANGDMIIKAPQGHRLLVAQLADGAISISNKPPAKKPGIANRPDSFSDAAQIGDILEDGTIYAGVSPDNGYHFAVPTNENIPTSCRKPGLTGFFPPLNNDGHTDWRVASPKEYEHLFRHVKNGALAELVKRSRTYYAVDAKGNISVVHPIQKLAQNFSKLGYKKTIPVRYFK